MSDTGAKPLTLPVMPVKRGTLQDEIYRRVCDLILDGEIAPGQLVTIQGLADAFGVSAMPVREALQRLTTAKALTVISGRSIGIPKLSLDLLTDLRRVRLEVETLAAVWALARLTSEDIARLDHLVSLMDSAIADGDVKRYLHGNREFHFKIYSASGSEVLLGLIETLWLRISPFFNLLHEAGNYGVANAAHKEIVRALTSHDPEALERGMRSDIESAAEVLERMLK
ncbi:GntR family transcriptional regulator [Microvirga sp. M2]|uniref:GntR family transcriptional regulator n=1 Tax=Microvirga sp. M2 TaxID=3073270 RepID=UPI0039C28C8D